MFCLSLGFSFAGDSTELLLQVNTTVPTLGATLDCLTSLDACDEDESDEEVLMEEDNQEKALDEWVKRLIQVITAEKFMFTMNCLESIEKAHKTLTVSISL